MRHLLPAALLFIGSAWAQTNPWFPQPLGQLKDFLQLSDSQLTTILANNDEYNRFAQEKQMRIAQVQREIVEETARSPLDPGALGIRYAEIEAICRHMKDQADQQRARNLEVLNQDQKVRLQVLEEAVRLAAVVSEAQYGNLIGGFTSAPSGFTSATSGFGGGAIGGIIGGANGCYLPFSTARWFNTTEFRREMQPSR